MNAMEMFFLMVSAHALADYPLQGAFLSRAKNHRAPLDGVPWYQALFAHAAIHAGFVGLITGSVFLAWCEFAAHSMIDYSKCEGKLSFNADQFLHVACKASWVLTLFLAIR